ISAALGLANAALYLRLSPGIEAPATAARARVSPATRRILARISSLFALDSLGGGFLTTALLSYYIYKRFGLSKTEVSALFVGAPEERVAASGVTHLVRLAAWAAGPTIAGALAASLPASAPIYIGCGLKALYDVLLWKAFRGVRPPEEAA